MPGTIKVSVLDFKGSQTSSSCSETSVKVSMGKREYQTWDKGDFTFPVTNLRERLSIVVIDANGNEISRRGIEIKMVMEKGLWEEIISLERGASVHMKLHFFLSEEERERIRVVRESALKKKHEELINNSTRIQKREARFAVNAESTMSQARGASGLSSQDSETGQNRSIREAAPGKLDQVSESMFEIKDEAGSDSILKQIIPVDHDAKVHRQYSVRETTHGRASKIIPLLEVPSLLRKVDSAPVLSLRSNACKPDALEKKQNLSEKAPSNVWKMIKAFEGSQTDQVKKLPKGLMPANPNHLANEGNVANTNLTGKMAPYDAQKDRPKETVEPNKQLNLSSLTSDNSDNFKELTVVIPQTVKRISLRKSKSGADLDILSVIERLSASEDAHSKGTQSPVNEKGEKETDCNDLNKLHIQRDLNDKLDTSRVSCYTEYCSIRSSAGPWTFPAPVEQLCITTSGKRVMDIVDRCYTETDSSCPEIDSSAPESIKENAHGGVETSICWKAVEKLRKPMSQNADDAGKSRGPVGKVMRAAIMVAFATLVLLTRQRQDG